VGNSGDCVISPPNYFNDDARRPSATVNRAHACNRGRFIAKQGMRRQLHPHVVEVNPQLLPMGRQMPSKAPSSDCKLELRDRPLTFECRAGNHRRVKQSGRNRQRYRGDQERQDPVRGYKNPVDAVFSAAAGVGRADRSR
jgi:hypothetical protein